jgi:hypothetical protein
MARRTPAHAQSVEEARLMQFEVFAREAALHLDKALAVLEHLGGMQRGYYVRDRRMGIALLQAHASASQARGEIHTLIEWAEEGLDALPTVVLE